MANMLPGGSYSTHPDNPHNGNDGIPDTVFHNSDKARIKKKCERYTQRWLPECDYEDSVKNGTQQMCNNCVKDSNKLGISIPCLRLSDAIVNRGERGPMARYHRETGRDPGLDNKTKREIDGEDQRLRPRRQDLYAAQRGSRRDAVMASRPYFQEQSVALSMPQSWSSPGSLQSQLDAQQQGFQLEMAKVANEIEPQKRKAELKRIRDENKPTQSHLDILESLRAIGEIFGAVAPTGAVARMSFGKRRRDNDDDDDVYRSLNPSKRPAPRR